MKSSTMNESNIITINSKWHEATITEKGYFAGIKSKKDTKNAIPLKNIRSIDLTIGINTGIDDIIVTLRSFTLSFDINVSSDRIDDGRAALQKYTELPENIYWRVDSITDINYKSIKEGNMNITLRHIG